MKTRLFTIASLFLFGGMAYSQTSSATESKIEIPKEVSLEERLAGTYELIRNNSTKLVEVFTTEMLKEVDARRAEHQDVVYKYSEYTTIRIYSRDKINAPGFKKTASTN